MTNLEVLEIILDIIREYMMFLIPIIGVLAGVTYVTSFLLSVTLRATQRSGRL